MSKELSSHHESLSDRETRPFVEDPALEKRLVTEFRMHAHDANISRILRKVDMRLIPMLSVMYILNLSGAVGGLIAGLITDNMQNRDGLPAWKWLFLIEGCLTVGFAIIAIFILPDFPATTRWLTAEEREYAISRLENDHNSTQAGNLSHLQSFLHAVRDWRTWMFVLCQSLCTCAGTITYFIPTLMAALEYKGHGIQYMTIPIYMVALVIVLVCSFSSDLLNERPKHIMTMSGMATVALIITATVENNKARYTFLAFGASGIWCCSTLTLSYLSNTICRPAEKRAVAIGLVNALANLSSVYSRVLSGSYIWPSNSAPRYIAGFSVSISLMFGTLLTACALMILTKKYPYENTKDGYLGDQVQSDYSSNHV
ncbi:hypothetical protein MHUMG1_09858 [Metarhizium humberi]|uniref:Uncharacterized protein n=1 Tax=Metarhizium humberi TaxID=2596975 RepID=A0A9P8S2K2_9HYPO|nr:hypothetical protein MHUMG1_09858 [Metarhizium humberi]